LIVDQATSGQSQTAFCSARSVSVTNFQNWKWRLKKEATKGKLNTSWYWPIYGEADGIWFTWSKSRGKDHVLKQLGDFQGTLHAVIRKRLRN
jgi:hypothetical protein